MKKALNIFLIGEGIWLGTAACLWIFDITRPIAVPMMQINYEGLAMMGTLTKDIVVFLLSFR